MIQSNGHLGFEKMGTPVIGYILEFGGTTKHDGATLKSCLGNNLQHQMQISFLPNLGYEVFWALNFLMFVYYCLLSSIPCSNFLRSPRFSSLFLFFGLLV
jgi:hypothetical protein